MVFARLRSLLKKEPDAVAAPPPVPSALAPGAALSEGEAFIAAGDFQAAALSFRSAVELSPGEVNALVPLGHALWRSGEVEEAIRRLETAVSIDGRSIDAHFLLAMSLQDAGRMQEAALHLEKVIELDPKSSDGYLSLFRLHLRVGDRDAADATAARGLQWCRRVTAVEPGNADLHNACGLLLGEFKMLTEALAAFDQALGLRPGFAQALNNRALTLRDLGRFEEALAAFDEGLASDPGNAQLHGDRGDVLRELVRHEDALASYERAQAIARKEEFFLNEGLSRLVLGDLAGGWPKYEWRWQASKRAHPNDHFGQPIWQGEQSLVGKTILVYAEQGLGDTLQFCRYAKCVSDLGARVILGVQPALVPVLEGLAGVDQVVALGPKVPVPAFDFHCPLLSLPLAFGTSLQTIPSPDAYIHPCGPGFGARLDRWQARLGPRDRLRIGLVWSGNAEQGNDKNRSMSLSEFATLVSDGARFVALQKEVRALDQPFLEARPDIEHYGSELVDFGDTAALISQLDLVISVCTSVAHLAAAMGKPVWVIVPFNPDWRWFLDRADSPWYDSVRVFRQTRWRDWSEVLAKVRQEVEKLVSAGMPTGPSQGSAASSDPAR